MIAANKASIPGNNELDAVSLWAAWLQGKVAMIYSWPPTGRMTAELFAERQGDQLHPAIARSPARSAMPSCPGNPEHATGYNKALVGRFGQSRGRLSVHAVGDARRRCRSPACMLPYALRDPYRLSHFKSELYGALWPEREGVSGQPQQLGQCRPARHDHARLAGLRPVASTACARRSGPAPIRRRRCETAAAEWDATTERLGVDCAEGLLRRVQEAARLLRRPHGREAGHGGEALERRSGRSSRMRAGPSREHRAGVGGHRAAIHASQTRRGGDVASSESMQHAASESVA